jgi:hypothetical protein
LHRSASWRKDTPTCGRTSWRADTLGSGPGSGPRSGALLIPNIDTRSLSKSWRVEVLGKKAPVAQEPSSINTDTTFEYKDASSAKTETAFNATEGDQTTDDNNDKDIKDN